MSTSASTACNTAHSLATFRTSGLPGARLHTIGRHQVLDDVVK